MTLHITHTLVKATAFENVCHFRTRVSVIVTHFLQAVFLTVHYVILQRHIPSVFSVINAETLSYYSSSSANSFFNSALQDISMSEPLCTFSLQKRGNSSFLLLLFCYDI